MRKRVKEVPIATVTWIDEMGREIPQQFFTQYAMESFITELRRENVVYFVCMMSMLHELPVRRVRQYGKAI